LKFNKKDIEQALKTITVPGEGQNMIDSQAVKNIIVFSDEVIVDITISNPSLQAKKRTEVDILKTIHELVYAKAKITVNIKVEVSNQPKSEVKGKSIFLKWVLKLVSSMQIFMVLLFPLCSTFKTRSR
jgi:ATP-binding protein involved in chromosome partitioning